MSTTEAFEEFDDAAWQEALSNLTYLPQQIDHGDFWRMYCAGHEL